jgi:phosphohistidine phosphatase
MYLASASALLDTADQLAANSSTLMLVAHNPGMTDLANRISESRIDNLPTCGVFVVDALADNWSDLADGRGELVYFWCPRRDLD